MANVNHNANVHDYLLKTVITGVDVLGLTKNINSSSSNSAINEFKSREEVLCAVYCV